MEKLWRGENGGRGCKLDERSDPATHTDCFPATHHTLFSSASCYTHQLFSSPVANWAAEGGVDKRRFKGGGQLLVLRKKVTMLQRSTTMTGYYLHCNISRLVGSSVMSDDDDDDLSRIGKAVCWIVYTVTDFVLLVKTKLDSYFVNVGWAARG